MDIIADIRADTGMPQAERTYQRTHPWISFEVRLQEASPTLWMSLGEAGSTCEHIAGVPLRPETAQLLHRVYMAKGVWATTAIEGNTLSEAEVLEHLQGQLKLPPSKEYLAKEVDNVVTACNFVWESCARGQPPAVTVDLVKDFNRRVLDGLSAEDDVVPGQVRSHSVGVGRYRGAPAEDCEYLLGRLCDWLNEPALAPQPGREIPTAILRAIIAHLYLAWIHPFGDGNGRTARLVEFLILVCAGVPTPTGHLLSNHYNDTRIEYYRHLDRASRANDVLGFIHYAVTGFVEQLRQQLQVIRQQQYHVAWQNYVHERFHDRDTGADQRRRRLLLDLSERDGPVRMNEIPNLSPKVAGYYGRRSAKTLARDLRELQAMELVVFEENGYRAKKELVLAFLPFTVRAG